MPSAHCNRPGARPPRTPTRRRSGTLAAGALGLSLLLACTVSSGPQAISVCTLETAQAVTPRTARRAILAASPQFSARPYPLDQRLELLQIRTAQQWEALRRSAPEIGPCPDLARGIVVVLTSHAGLPLNGNWPIHLELAHVHQGAGFVIASFEGGSFLPDGTTYLEAAQFDGLRVVLMAEINGVRFYPE